jgi:hypothetical protein
VNTERPLPVSASCASAILEGQKSVARYVAAQPPGDCPLGKPGDLLWVAEPWASVNGTFHHKAVTPAPGIEWQPSRSMPRDRTRALVRLLSTRLEHLQEISASDIAAEGNLCAKDSPSSATATEGFARWWDSLHPRQGTQWADNPVVWVVAFEKIPA